MVAAAAWGLLLVACGGDASPRPAATTTSATPVGPLRLGIGPVGSLDPAAASPDSPSASIVADMLYDGLPSLSTAMSTSASSDGDVDWTFELDPAVTFSDGTPITADDVVATLERARALGESSLPATRLDVVRSIEAVGGAVVVELVRPMQSLPDLLDAPAFGIVPADGPFDGTVGSGPFRLLDDDGDRLVLEPAPGRSVAATGGVELHRFADLDDAGAAFDEGSLDWTLVEAVGAGGGDVKATPFQAIVFYGFNLADPRFADLRFRQAVAQAIDRKAIVDAVYPDLAEALTTIVPEGAGGLGPGGCTIGCAYDPDISRALLVEVFGSGPVPEVPIDHPAGEDEQAVAGMLAAQLAEVGIPSVVRPHPADEYAAFAVSGQQGLASLGWIGVAPTAEDYLDRLFRSGSPDNFVGFSDAHVDALLDAGALGEAEAEVLRAVAVVSLAQFQVLSRQSGSVEGLELSLDGTFDPTTAFVR